MAGLAGPSRTQGDVTAEWSGGDLFEIPQESPHVMKDVSLFVLEHVVVRPEKLNNLRERVSVLEAGFPSVNELHLNLIQPFGASALSRTWFSRNFRAG